MTYSFNISVGHTSSDTDKNIATISHYIRIYL
jgi:hypothetical protein